MVHQNTRKEALNMKRIEIEGRTIYAIEFTSLEAAWELVNRSKKSQRIILGDAPTYWVVTSADAQRLIRAGYEMA